MTDPSARIETIEWSVVRDRFVLDDLVYLDGNSLGRPLRASLQAVQRALVEEWAGGLIGWAVGVVMACAFPSATAATNQLVLGLVLKVKNNLANDNAT